MEQRTKEFLKTMLDNPESRPGRRFATLIQLLIVVSLVTFSLDTLPGLTPREHSFLHGCEVVTVAVFTLEYLLRLYVAERKLRFVFSFFSMIDLLSILPFYLAAGVDLRAVRALRMLRLFRILKLGRYNRAVQRVWRAFMIAREELVIFYSATFLVLFVASVGIYHFERDAQPATFGSVFHCLWWAIETMTTVGYGDVIPITLGGRIFTFLMIMCGLGIVGMPAGIMASALTRAAEEERC
jgi:voltage-gated potassium channel